MTTRARTLAGLAALTLVFVAGRATVRPGCELRAGALGWVQV